MTLQILWEWKHKSGYEFHGKIILYLCGWLGGVHAEIQHIQRTEKANTTNIYPSLPMVSSFI